MPSTIPKQTGFGSRRRTTDVVPGLVVDGHMIPTDLSFTFANGAAQYGVECEIAVLNCNGQVIPGTHVLDVYLSDDVAGQGVSSAGMASTVTSKSASGVVLGIMTTAKAFRVITLATGKFTLYGIDDVSLNLLYVAATIPCIGKVLVSRKTVSGDYKP